jgi:hypothetical protein
LLETDLASFDDLLIIGVEILNDLKVYDPSVLNPYNFMQISLLEFGLKKSPNNKSFLVWLIKLTSKLGLTSMVTDLSKQIPRKDVIELEKIGAIKFSHFSEYGVDKELD